jgi:hypothetical protein
LVEIPRYRIMPLVLCHLKEWHPEDPFPYRIYWKKAGDRFPYNNHPHAILLNTMETFIKERAWQLEPYWEKQTTAHNQNWQTSFHTGFRFKHETEAMLFWLRFNGDDNAA